MSRFVLDTMVVLLLVLVGVSFIGDSTNSNKSDVSINQVIDDFENDIDDGNVIEDGYGIVNEEAYRTNRLSNVTSSVGGFIVDGADFALDMIQKLIKSIVG